MNCKTFWKQIWLFRKALIFLLVPILLLPLPLAAQTEAGKCAYVLILMAVYWTTEAIPLPVTSLIPMVMYPLMGLIKAKELSMIYFKDTNMLLIGGLVVAIAIENSGIHKRLALKILTLVGAKPKWLMMGFMLPTWFMSMWISNTASTAMMMPVVAAVLEQMDKPTKTAPTPHASDTDKEIMTLNTISNGGTDNPEFVNDENQSDAANPPPYGKVQSLEGQVGYEERKPSLKNSFTVTEIDTEAVDDKRVAKFSEVCKALTLCVAYAANVGGTATITGTGPNLVLKGEIDAIYEKKNMTSPVTFATWMGMCLPAAALMLILIWIALQLVFLGFRDSIFWVCRKRDADAEKQEAAIKDVIREEYKKLGPIRFNEIAVTVFLIVTVLLWFFRDPGFMPGWAAIFKKGYTSGSTPAIFISVLLFIFPSEWPNFFCLRRKNDKREIGPVPALLDWQTCNRKMSWNVVLLIGGGFALAEGVKRSGLSQWIGNQLTVFKPLPGWLLVFVLCLLVAFLTEITSNSATATILMPIMATLAEGIGKNPLYLMFPIAVSTSFAFMLPVATPPNAIAYSTGQIQIKDMARGGFSLNFLCVFVITLAVHTWGMAIFKFNVIPWPVGSTTVASVTTAVNYGSWDSSLHLAST